MAGEEAKAEKPPWWLDAVKTLGLPTVFLGVVVYMVWSAGKWASTEVVIPLFNKQIAFIDKASEMTTTMQLTMTEINRTLNAHSEHSIETLRLAAEISKACHETNAETQLNSERIKTGNQEVISVLKKIEENTSGARSIGSESPDEGR